MNRCFYPLVLKMEEQCEDMRGMRVIIFCIDVRQPRFSMRAAAGLAAIWLGSGLEAHLIH